MKRRLHNNSLEGDDNNCNGHYDIESHEAIGAPNPPSQQQKQHKIKEMQEQHHKLTVIEIMLTKEYQKLVQEEHQLRLALQQSKESGRERMIREKKEKEEEALHRLEAALMMDDRDEEDSSCSDDGDNDEGNKLVARKGKNELSQVLESEEESTDDDEMDEEKILEML